MEFQGYQKQVHDWIQQYKIGYFSPMEILAQLTEEQGEVAEAIENKDVQNLEEELAGVMFPILCLANSQEIHLSSLLTPVPKYISLDILTTYDGILGLIKYSGKVSREVSHLFGPKKKKEYEHTDGLFAAMNETIHHIRQLAEINNLDMDVAFEKHMNKLYGRDNKRWEKK